MHLFYQPLLKKEKFCLENDEYHHCIQVLRHQTGDIVHITDGQGAFWEVELTNHKKKVIEFSPISQVEKEIPGIQVHIMISPTKQMDRMEWFVEKACEIGVDKITFIETKNSERRKLKLDRLEKKTVSALKQSKSAFKTQLEELIKFDDAIKNISNDYGKYIAFVDEEASFFGDVLASGTSTTIVIGPEGDFTNDEIESAMKSGFEKISLGKSVLRTETAGIYALSAVSILEMKKG